MDGTPHRKKAHFSQHPQVFEYSSKSKKQGQCDNDSFLLDNQQYGENQKQTKQDQLKDQGMTIGETQLQIDQITSDLAEIQAYLQLDNTKGIDGKDGIPELRQLTPSREIKKNDGERNEGLNISINPELKGSREGTNCQHEGKLKSSGKQQNEISNTKTKVGNDGQVSRQKSIEERIQNQIKKNKRITMDTQELMNMLNDYKYEFDARKIKDDRKNRITIDVFALTKLIENAAEQAEQNQQEKPPQSLTPIRKTQRSSRKSKVFSTFKQSPHQAQIKLYVAGYLSDVGKRVQERAHENRKLLEWISELKSQIVKIELKISDVRKRLDKSNSEKEQIEKKLKIYNHELNKRKYLQDNQIIRTIQNQLMIKILKFNTSEEGCYGHFIFDDIFLKAKSKTKIGSTQLKFMIPQEVKESQKYFVISTEDCTNLIKKYHSLQTDKMENFLEVVSRVRQVYLRLKKLDRELYYFSLSFEVRDFELSTSFDKLNFQVSLGGSRFILIEIAMNSYLSNQFDERSISVYDPDKPGYINLSIEAKVKGSGLFERMKILINEDII